MKKKTLSLVIVTVLATTSLTASDGGNSTFDEISVYYEAVRQVLMKDSTEGVVGHASAMRDAASSLRHDFSAESAGVPPDAAQAARELLPEVERRAGELAEATDLEAVRAAFSELTRPLARWHGLVEGDRPVVAYCPMVKKPWLQPDEAVGNPYDPSMLRCGKVIAR